ncbi:MAG: ABC transporter substrate-binding protein [Methanoregula sp.]|nr:ABC transporter substrate-binding protein [Methanoregula sp.]
MEKKTQSIVIIAAILIIAGIAIVVLSGAAAVHVPSSPSAEKNTKTITDMMGRTLVVPQNIDRVLATSPPTTIEAYVLAPDKLIGVNFNTNAAPDGSVYMPAKYRNLTVVGGWFGTQTGNYESFIAMDPDIILDMSTLGDTNAMSTVSERQQKFGTIPVVGITDAANVTQYDPSIIFLGTLLGEEQQAASLSEFYKRVLTKVTSRVSSIPTNEKVRVYYAEGPKGLQTDPTGSPHSELIDLAGGTNIADCAITPGNGKTTVSLEQVTKWSPDVIIVGDPAFYATIYNDTLWQQIPAVKNHKVYLVPQSPFTWFDRPPGVNRIIGIPWMAKILYPEKFSDIDMPALTKEFYTKFYHYDLTDSEVNTLVDPTLR